MRKSFSFLAIIVSIFVFISCNDGSTSIQGQLPTDNSEPLTISSLRDIVYDMSVFSHLKANISTDTVAIGLQQVSSGSTSRGLDTYLDSIIVKQDEGSEAEPVQFEVVTSIDENGNKIVGFDGEPLKDGDIITQGIIPSKVDKLYVGGDFTFVSYVTVDAYKLFNSLQTSTSTDSNGNVFYNGSQQFDWYSDQNGGYSNYLSWSYSSNYFDSYKGYISLNYNYQRWWYDSNGQYCNSNINTYENISLRELSVLSQAPNERKGVMKYDVNDYYTSDFRKSYIIDNNTGLIYELSDNLHLSILRGVAIDEELGPVDLIPQEDGSLLIKPFVESNLIAVYDVFEDIYGQTYILNDSLSQNDGKTVFFTNKGEYVPTQDGKVLHFQYGNNTYNCYSNVISVSEIGENFSENTFDATKDVSILYDTSLDSYYEKLPSSLIRYNENTGNNRYNWNYDEPYQCSAYFLEIRDGILYLMENNYYRSNPGYAKLDFSTLDLFLISLSSSSQVFFSTYLDNGNILIASKESGNSLYTINWASINDLSKLNVSILKSNGQREWLGNTFDEFKKQYMEETDTSIGYDDNLASSCKYYYCDNYQQYEKENSYEAWSYDYIFYKKNIIGTSFGYDNSMLKEGVYFDQSPKERYEKNIEGVVTEDYTYSWYKYKDKGTSIGFSKEYYDKGYIMTQVSSTKYKAVLEYVPVEGTTYPYSGYAFYDDDKNFLGTGYSPSEMSNYPEATSYEYYENWIHYPNKKQSYDYQYKWREKIHVADTHGLNPDYLDLGYSYERNGLLKDGTPEYLSDYDYTYYTRDIIVQRFGPNMDYDWGDAVYSEPVYNTYRYDTMKYKSCTWDSLYHYMNYKEGYTEESVNKIYAQSNLNTEFIIGDINVTDNTFQGKNGFEIELMRKNTTGATVYVIISTEDGYEVVESGTIESNKSSIVLQPINRV